MAFADLEGYKLLACVWSDNDGDGRASGNFNFDHAGLSGGLTIKIGVDGSDHSSALSFRLMRDWSNTSDDDSGWGRVDNGTSRIAGSLTSSEGNVLPVDQNFRGYYIAKTQNAGGKRFRVSFWMPFAD